MSKLVSELTWAQNEFKQDDTDVWQPGRNSTATLEGGRSGSGSWTSAGAVHASTGANRSSWGPHDARLSWRKIGAVERRLENRVMEKGSCDLARHFGRICRHSTQLVAQNGKAKVGASSWYPCQSEWSPEREGTAKLQWTRNGCRVWGERNRERGERKAKFLFLFVITSILNV